MFLSDDEIVHHAGIGCLEAVETRYRAGGADRSEGEGRGEGTRGVVAEEHHLARERIDLRMRGERSGDAAGIIAEAAGLERAGLDLGRQVRFLQRQEASAVE